jgi:hypothetical protein
MADYMTIIIFTTHFATEFQGGPILSETMKKMQCGTPRIIAHGGRGHPPAGRGHPPAAWSSASWQGARKRPLTS